MAHLVVLDGPDKGKRYELTAAVMRIGRLDSNDIRIDGPAVSGTHCELSRMANGLFARDLGSTNGTLANEEPLDPEQPLARNDILSLGTTHVMVAGDDLPPGENSIRRDTARVTVRPRGEAPAPVTGGVFTKRRNPRRIWNVVLVLLGVVALVALAWFFLAVS